MYSTRLKKGQDLKQSICEFVIENSLSSACVVSAVGSLETVVVRMAGAKPDSQDVRKLDGSYEIVSLVGTVDCEGKAHLHISFSDETGKVLGGHLKDGSIIDTTVELVIMSNDKVKFIRKPDEDTGFDELFIDERRGE